MDIRLSQYMSLNHVSSLHLSIAWPNSILKIYFSLWFFAACHVQNRSGQFLDFQDSGP